MTPTAAHTLSPAELDKLEALACAADQGEGQHIYDNPRDSNNWKANEAWHHAASPEVFLDLIAQARAALTGQATAPAQAAPSEQDEPIAYAIFGIGGGKHYLRDVKMIPKGDTTGEWKTDDDGLGNYWAGNEPLSLPRAAQGASGAPTEPTDEQIIEALHANGVETHWSKDRGVASDRSTISVARMRKVFGQLSQLVAPSSASGAQGEPTGATGAAGGEVKPWEERLYKAQPDARNYLAHVRHEVGAKYKDEEIAEHRARAAASQAAPGVGAERQNPSMSADHDAMVVDLAKQLIEALERAYTKWPEDEQLEKKLFDVLAERQPAALPAPAQPAEAASSPVISVETTHDGVSEITKTRYRLCTCGGNTGAPHAPVVRADVPAGVKLVPEIPTAKMETAGFKALIGSGLHAACQVDSQRCYAAMLAASPSPSAPQDPRLAEQEKAEHLLADVQKERADRRERLGLAPGAPRGQEAARPVGQIRTDLERANVVWFGPLPPHGTNLYAAPVAGEAPAGAQWSKEPPTEQADYWNWNGDPDHAPMIYHVLWSGTAKKCFVSIGQYDITNAIFCDTFGGWWLKIEQPAIPSGHDSANGGERSGE